MKPTTGTCPILKRPPNRVALNRALSKLGILSRVQATDAIRAGRVRVGGHVVRDPAHLVVPERADIAVDGELQQRRAWRTILFHKPRGVVTTRRDPQGRRTIFDVLGEDGRGLIAVGRLDKATSGLLLLTSDTQLANWITDPANAVPRVYVVTVRGAMTERDVGTLTAGVVDGRERLRAENVTILKASGRESHLTVELREGKYREVRRLFDAIGHDVMRLKRVTLGGVDLGALEPGRWRELSREDARAAFPGYGADVTQPFRAARRRRL